MFVHRTIDGFLHRFAHEALAELFFQKWQRNLAFAKALHFDLGLRFAQLLVYGFIKLIGGNENRISAL